MVVCDTKRQQVVLCFGRRFDLFVSRTCRPYLRGIERYSTAFVKVLRATATQLHMYRSALYIATQGLISEVEAKLLSFSLLEFVEEE